MLFATYIVSFDVARILSFNGTLIVSLDGAPIVSFDDAPIVSFDDSLIVVIVAVFVNTVVVDNIAVNANTAMYPSFISLSSPL